MPTVDDDTRDRSAVDAWAASGAMQLTGRRDGPPLGPPRPLVERMRVVAGLIDRRSAELGRQVRLDPIARLAERAAVAGLERNGRISCGGGTRLVRTADGWLAVSLVRADDVDLVPAWLGPDAVPPDAVSSDADTQDEALWDTVADASARRPTSALVERGALLGMAVAALPPATPGVPRAPSPLAPLPYVATRVGDQAPVEALDGVVVADLSSLWAGPLCGSVLADAGARVVKVESTGRPDGARQGPPAFFDLMNAGKRAVAVDFADPDGRRTLRALLERVDVVIEASRPRALEQLGIDARSVLTAARPRVWLSITGHGRHRRGRDRVAFGDDAAVAGGLVAWEGDVPCFCADAVADPTTGMVAAAGVLDALAAGGRWLIDVRLAGVAAHLSGPTIPVPAGTEVAAPRAREPRGRAPRLGADTVTVLHELGIRA